MQWKRRKRIFNVAVLRRQYKDVKKAIPEQWLDDISKGGESENKMDVVLKCKDKWIDFNLGTVKMFYCFFRNSVFKKPVANQF